MIELISYGGGVQSTCLLLKAINGDFGSIPQCAVFADPGWETKATYEWIERVKAYIAPFPIIHLREKNIRHDASPHTRRNSMERFVTLPTFLEGGGMGRRQCTKEFKLQPLQKYWRSLGATAKNPVQCWIGISTDEAMRMKPSLVKYAVNRYPLIEAGMSREDCQNYLVDRLGSPAPKSSCIGCPFHGDGYWAQLRAESPEEFEDACKFDDEIRNGVERQAKARMRNRQFLHRSCIPLRDIKEFKHENQLRMFHDAFGNECEGMCGT